MKKPVIGILCTGFNTLEREDKMFLELAREKGIDLVIIDIYNRLEEKALKNIAYKCDLIYVNTADEAVEEYIKTLEEFGKKVIESSEVYYYIEDKWMSYLTFKKNKIPTPKTILLPENIVFAKEELKGFGEWPVILKRIYGTMGEYVEKADNLQQAERIMKKFWKKGSQRIQIIAQEMINSPSYRVTVIDKKIVQTAIKESKSWKCTGVYEKKFKKINIDKNLNDLIGKVIKAVKINICGIDLLKKNDEWLVLEVNAQPAFDFFPREQKKLVSLTLDFLKKVARNTKKNHL